MGKILPNICKFFSYLTFKKIKYKIFQWFYKANLAQILHSNTEAMNYWRFNIIMAFFILKSNNDIFTLSARAQNGLQIDALLSESLKIFTPISNCNVMNM